MNFRCPKCNQEYQFDESRTGRIFSCLECGNDFVLAPRAPARRAARWLLVSAITLLFILGAGAGVGILLYRSARRAPSEEVPRAAAATPAPISAERQRYLDAKAALQKGDAIALARLLRDMNVNDFPPGEFPLLMLAIQQNRQDLAQLLIAEKADVNRENQDGWTAPVIAAANNNVSMLRFLVSHGAYVNGVISVESPLGIAAEKGNLDAVKFLISETESLNESVQKEKAIFRAIRNRHVECFGAMLPKYDIETTDSDGNTILMAAIASGKMEAVQLALQKDARTDAKNKQGVSAFMMALRADNPGILAIFGSHRIDYDQSDGDGNTISIICAQTGNWSLLEKALTDNNKNARNKAGCNVFYYVCKTKNADLVPKLLQMEVEFDAPVFENSAWFAALSSGNTTAVKAILQKKIDLKAADAKGNDALMLAAESGSLVNVQHLLAAGHPVLNRNKSMKTALDIARECGYREITALLQAKVNQEMNQRITVALRELEQSSGSYSAKQTTLDELDASVPYNPEARQMIAAVRDRLRAQAQTDASLRIDKAMKDAKANKNYAAASQNLEGAITANPLAANLAQAQALLQDLKKRNQVEQLRAAERRKKHDRLARMTEPEIAKELTLFINLWLQGMRLGKSTSELWLHPILSSTLYDVKVWEIIGVADTWSPSFNKVRVMVESSTKGGFPIRKTWTVTFTRNDDLEWKILSLEE